VSGPVRPVSTLPTISAIVQTFGLQQKLGWFVSDNASNNDTCIEALGSEVEFDHFERRIRCIGHVINLVARSLLFGKELEALMPERNSYLLRTYKSCVLALILEEASASVVAV
jgi:hypothetical protein